jgi:nucleoside-diphosphate-sugar epimerase
MGGRVLITGIGSFTGPYVAQSLIENGHEVFGLSHPDSDSISGVTLIEGNLLDQAGLNTVVNQCRPDYVIHLAAITFVPHGDVAEIYQTNVVGTRNLLQALEQCSYSPSKIILASSANVYGNSVEGQLDEDTPFSPANDYANSKVAMEFMARIWSDRLPIAFVRPFNYTGLGQSSKFLIPKIVDHFRDKSPAIELGNIDVIRDFSDVRFISASYKDLVDLAVPGEVYNLCSGVGRSLSDIINLMNEMAGYEIEVSVNPAFVRANEVRQLIGDNTRLLTLCPSLDVIPIQDTLKWMYSGTS